MARKKKAQIDRHAGVPRGAEHTVEADTFPPAPRSKNLRLNEDGSERVSTEPVVMRVKHRLIGDPDLIRMQIQRLRATALDGTEFETFEEADDFDVDDAYGEFTSTWEISADHDSSVDAYIQYKRTGEIPEWVATKLAKQLPQGTPPSPKPGPQDQSFSPPGPAPQEP